jgi:hypothetical protein
MKRKVLFLSTITILILSACQLPAPDGGPAGGSGSPTATQLVMAGAATATTAAEETAEEAAGDKPQPTNTKPPAVTNTSPAPTATQVPPTATSRPETASQDPTRTPTKTRQPAVAFDPYTTYGEPDYENDMVYANYPEWMIPESRVMPDDQNIRLVFKDGKLYVTGKQTGFSTWWFTYHFLEDFYLEMTFDTETCSGNDAYGMIFRGPEHLAGVSYGYVVAFTCDGDVWVFRLDGVDPWDAEDLVDEYPSSYVKTGSNKQNVIGVRAEGDTISVIANGSLIETIEDDEFSKGRFGVFVRAADTDDYTYRLTRFAYWDLLEDEE